MVWGGNKCTLIAPSKASSPARGRKECGRSGMKAGKRQAPWSRLEMMKAWMETGKRTRTRKCGSIAPGIPVQVGETGVLASVAR